MYYKSVNRGLIFTKPGLYGIGLILLVGMIAIGSGINSLYIFLSMGLAGFIVSGLLSERVMRAYQIKNISAPLAEAGQPFTMRMQVANRGSRFTVMGIQNYLMLEPPRFQFVSKPIPAPASCYTVKVEAGRSLEVNAECDGLPRGYYRELIAFQRTSYPFGFLEKYKLSKVSTTVLVAPAFDELFGQELRQGVMAPLAQLAQELEFYSHRPYNHTDSLKHVDWRKSAGKPPAQWAIKHYKSPLDDGVIVVRGAWQEAIRAGEAEYEAYWERLRTALAVLNEAGRNIELTVDHWSVIGYQEGLRALAELPKFADREQGLPEAIEHGPVRRVAELRIEPSRWYWQRLDRAA